MLLSLSKEVRQQEERIEQLLAQSEGRFQRAIQNNLSQITDGRRFNRLERLIQNEEYEQAINESARILAETVNQETVQTYTTGGFEAARFVEGAIGLQINYNAVNQRAVSQLQQNNLRLVREFTEQQRAASMQAIDRGVREGLNPRQQARNFRNSIGLTAKQEEWVANYRRSLEEQSARALQYELRDHRFDGPTRRATQPDAAPLTPAQIARYTERYRERALKYRAEVIARTESLRALNGGMREGFQQAIDDGHIDKNQLTREWSTSRDERVRSSHAPMNGQKRAFDEPFQTGAGVSIMLPGDPNAPGSETIQCRCIVATRIDPTREQQQQARSQAQTEPRREEERRQRRRVREATTGDDVEITSYDIDDPDDMESLSQERVVDVSGNTVRMTADYGDIGAIDGRPVGGYSLNFQVNDSYDMGSVGNPRDGARVALRVRENFREMVRDMPDGTVLINSPWNDDGRGADRARMYRRFGFGDIDERSNTQYAVVRGGRAVPISVQRLERNMNRQGIESELPFASGNQRLNQSASPVRFRPASEGRVRAVAETVRPTRRTDLADIRDIRLRPQTTSQLANVSGTFRDEIDGNIITGSTSPIPLAENVRGDELHSVSFAFEVNSSFDMGSVEDPRAAARMAMRIRNRFRQEVRRLPEGTIVSNTPWDMDGRGADRERMYSRFGFGPATEMGTQFGVVREGKVQPLDNEQMLELTRQAGFTPTDFGGISTPFSTPTDEDIFDF